MNWIFKTGDHLQVDKGGQKALALFAQKRVFSGRVGEAVLILEKKKGKWEFTALFQITEISIEDPEAEFKQITVTLGLQKQFENKLLEDYIYSLKRITNYGSVIKHFSRKYSRLFDAEFEAIVEDKIYIKRTIVGTILNAMHRDHQEGFVAFIAQESPGILTGGADLDKTLQLLLLYLDFAIIKPAQYLRESAEILRSILSDDEYAEIGFAADLDNLTFKTVQLIKPQVDAIDSYLSAITGTPNQPLSRQVLELDDQPKFKKLFRNSGLPFKLN